MKKGKYVYKNADCMKKVHDFYDRSLAALNVPYAESCFDTSFGKTHSLLCGDAGKPKICTIHGGNGITTLNLKLFLPLLADHCLIAPDVIGMPGKSEPYRNISSGRDEYGLWMKEVLDFYGAEKIPFVVSSYSSAMFLSFAKNFPERVEKAVLLVPSGIAHGPVMPMLSKTVVPFIKHYFCPGQSSLDEVIEAMGGKGDAEWREFFDIMMSSYKMELRPPKEYGKKELSSFNAPLLVIASDKDIFFPAERVFKRADEIFSGPVSRVKIDSKHLPSEEMMKDICGTAIKFLNSDIPQKKQRKNKSKS